MRYAAVMKGFSTLFFTNFQLMDARGTYRNDETGPQLAKKSPSQRGT